VNIYTSRSYERNAFIAIGGGLQCVCFLRCIHSVCLYSRPKTSQGWYLTAPEFQTDIFSSLYSDTAHVMCTDSPGTMHPLKEVTHRVGEFPENIVKRLDVLFYKNSNKRLFAGTRFATSPSSECDVSARNGPKDAFIQKIPKHH
jgi:hypothetical protein